MKQMENLTSDFLHLLCLILTKSFAFPSEIFVYIDIFGMD